MAKNQTVFSSRQETHPVRRFFAGLIVLMLLLFVFGFAMNLGISGQVVCVTQKVTVQNLPDDLENFSIMLISDLKGKTFGKKQQALISSLTTTRVSCVVFAGDMTGPGGDYTAFIDLVNALPSDVSKYLIAGDSDPSLTLGTAHSSLSVYSEWVEAAMEAGVRVLDEPMVEIRGKKKLYLVPEYLYSLDLDGMQSAYQKRIETLDLQTTMTADDAASRRLCEYQLEKIGRIRETIAGMKAEDIQIAVTHMPLDDDYIRAQRQVDGSKTKVFSLRSVSLVLAGHTCGGQWRIPGVGAVYDPDYGWFPEDTLVKGLSYHGGTWQYISPGLAASDVNPFPGRLFNEPEVTIIYLTSKIV